MENELRKSNLSILRELEVGGKHSWPISKLSVIKSNCSTFGLQWNKKFRTQINRRNKTIEVTRIA